jgi:hypothetical protein
MKCDLCQHQVFNGKLCQTCTEMMQRLLMIDHRLHAREECEAARLARLSSAAQSTASGRS